MARNIQSECDDCLKETNHEVLYNYGQQEEILDENDKVLEKLYYDFKTIRCLGCDNVSFLRVTKVQDKNKKFATVQEAYPNTSRKEYDTALDFLNYQETLALPPLVKNLYTELEEVFSTDLPILTGIGLRTLLEAICIHQNIKGRNLREKIDNLQKDGLIAAKDLPVLHNLREIGNVTVHQIKKPTKKTLNYSLEILNHTLKSLYVIPRLHAKLERNRISKN